MSRIGKKPVAVPSGVTATLVGALLTVKGPKGEMKLAIADEVECTVEGSNINVKPRSDSNRARGFWGMQRTLVNNLVTGVTQGFTEVLEFVGVGYKANVQGQVLNLALGFSHDVAYPIPAGITIKCPDATTVEISGSDKQKVGQVAAEIRKYRKPEPYKGKGVKYRGEKVFRKEGKKK
jgi:large subunit ribosomal protein L6